MTDIAFSIVSTTPTTADRRPSVLANLRRRRPARRAPEAIDAARDETDGVPDMVLSAVSGQLERLHRGWLADVLQGAS